MEPKPAGAASQAVLAVKNYDEMCEAESGKIATAKTTLRSAVAGEARPYLEYAVAGAVWQHQGCYVGRLVPGFFHPEHDQLPSLLSTWGIPTTGQR